MSTTPILGSNTLHVYSQNDHKGRCPGCYSDNTMKVGVLTVDGTPRDVNKCNPCNRLFSGVDGGIRSLVDEAQATFKTENVGFVSHLANDHTNTGNTGASDPNLNQALNNLTNSLNNQNTSYDPNSQKFDQMNSNMTNINSSIYSLTEEVRKLAQQNIDLMKKLSTDPLISIRKAVSEFNLK